MSICCCFLYCTKYLKQNNRNVQFNNMIIAKQSNEGIKSGGEEGGQCNESNSKNNCNYNFKGKMKDLKDHLDKSYNWIPVKQSISYEITVECK
ncbi:hypothetical protein RFI_39192, partial [Reticulomyxa filosa]